MIQCRAFVALRMVFTLSHRASSLPEDEDPEELLDSLAAGQAGVEYLDRISTRWSQLNDPRQFVLRYVPAARRYLHALLKQAELVDEVMQDFLLRVVQRGFQHARPDRGRFRDYLKTTLRHAALAFLRRRRPVQLSADDLDRLPANPLAVGSDDAWLREWRNCLLERTWLALEQHEKRGRGNHAHAVLRLLAEFPEEDSTQHAARLSLALGTPMTPEAFRKQVSRARRLFAEFLCQEVANTIDRPSDRDILDELRTLDLWSYVERFLPVPGTPEE